MQNQNFWWAALGVVVPALMACPSAWAVNKCPGPDGKVVFQDMPCPNSGSNSGRDDPKTGTRSTPARNPNVMSPADVAKALNDGVAPAAEKQRQAAELRHKEESAQEPAMIRVGMRADEVMRLWGAPHKVNRTVTALGVSEQWIYYRGRYKTQYTYIENGVLTAVQDVSH